MFSLCIDAPKGPSCYLQNIVLQFYIGCHKNYYATSMLFEKLCYMKSNINFRDQAWNRPPTKDFKDFILPHEHHAQNFY